MDTNSNHADSTQTATVSEGLGTESRPGQEFVRATVHLAGGVEHETGHAAHYAAAHVQARIGSALIYLLDYLAARDFATAVTAAAARAADARLFGGDVREGLPGSLQHPGQETSVIVRLRGRQHIAPAHEGGRGCQPGRTPISNLPARRPGPGHPRR